jgi:hypothetical protein
VSGHSYATDDVPPPGAAVAVEYAVEHPEVARVVGQQLGEMPIVIMFFLPIFPGVGLLLLLPGLLGGWRNLRLLQGGLLARGRLVEQRGTNTRINNRPVMALTFEYQVRGQTYRVDARTHEPEYLTDEAEEKLLHDPFRPERAVMLDALPGRPVIDGRGGLAPRPGRGAVAVLILPTIAVVGNLIGLAVVLS